MTCVSPELGGTGRADLGDCRGTPWNRGWMGVRPPNSPLVGRENIISGVLGLGYPRTPLNVLEELRTKWGHQGLLSQLQGPREKGVGGRGKVLGGFCRGKSPCSGLAAGNAGRPSCGRLDVVL